MPAGSVCAPCRAGEHAYCDGACPCRSWLHRDDDYEPDYDPIAEEREIERRLARYERSVYGEIGDLP